MPKPPPSGPHSDITGVNRDARVNTPSRDADKGSAGALDDADKQSSAQPDEGSVADKPA